MIFIHTCTSSSDFTIRDIETCKRQLKRRFEIEASDKDCVVIQRVCEAVSTRAARLTAAGIVALVKKIKKTGGCTVAVDSFLYIQHPQFLKRYYMYTVLQFRAAFGGREWERIFIGWFDIIMLAPPTVC